MTRMPNLKCPKKLINGETQRFSLFCGAYTRQLYTGFSGESGRDEDCRGLKATEGGSFSINVVILNFNGMLWLSTFYFMCIEFFLPQEI